MAVVNASGFAGLENSPLARIGYSKYVIRRGWERDFLPEITNSSWDKEIVQCNQIIQFDMEPYIGPMRPYDRTQDMIDDEATPQAICLEICQSDYKSIAISNMDMHRLCDRADTFINTFGEQLYKVNSMTWKRFVLNRMILEAARTNKGLNAGISCDVNLGAPGAPRVVTPMNINELFSAAARVLEEQNRWEDGKMFVVVDSAIKEAVLNSPNFFAFRNIGTTPVILLTGQLPGTLGGFDVYVTNSLARPVDPGIGTVHSVVFGHKDAYAFAGDVLEGRIMPAERSFTRKYQVQTLYDGKALMPDALAVALVTLQPAP